MEGGMAAIERIVTHAELPTAVVCSNDMTAIGVLHGLYRTTHKVPTIFPWWGSTIFIWRSSCCRR